ncbi:MAG: tetratricopeptide repeat protein, partial [Limisphaerales bacterium]
MGQIIKFPVPASKLGYKRVPKRGRKLEDPSQLQLFPQPTAQVLQFASGLNPFEHALMLDERGDPCAVELYLKAITDEDCAADAYCNLGIIESNQGRTAKALDCFTNALKLNPRHSEAHYNLGNVYFEVNDFLLAQIHYELAAQLDPSFPNVYFNLGLVLSINKELAAAVKAFVQYQQMVPREEGEKADELLKTLQKSLLAS